MTASGATERAAAQRVAHEYIAQPPGLRRLAGASIENSQIASHTEILDTPWHTQGSGKSYSMVFFCQKVHRKVSAAYTFVLLTDRKELDDQIYKTFVGCGVSTNKSDKATGAEGLERLLKDENRRYVSA